jgi:Fe-S cluster assembly protein SufD
MMQQGVMSQTDYLREAHERLQQNDSDSVLAAVRAEAFGDFSRMGIPTTRNEEWKYTRISGIFNKPLQLAPLHTTTLTEEDIAPFRLPGHEQVNQLVFINGIFSEEFSVVRDSQLIVLPLEVAAAGEYKPVVDRYFNHSSSYQGDGVTALNTAFVQGGVFVHVPDRQTPEHAVYIYNITDARLTPVLSQPRSLLHLGAGAVLQIVETYVSLGASDSMTNQVAEFVVEQDAHLTYCKIQNDAPQASQISTSHIRQVGRSVVNAVTVTLNGGIVRNNLNIIMEADRSESHMYGLYFPNGKTHVDNHTAVDNVAPGCVSNELYKGILAGQSTGVFNGKVYVRKDAQQTNAFQSNKNILLSEEAGVNTKPQLEIFADDVKCSHGCTVGSVDEEALFYLQSRGISREAAMALLLQGFAADILEKIKPARIRVYVEQEMSRRLISEVS